MGTTFRGGASAEAAIRAAAGRSTLHTAAVRDRGVVARGEAFGCRRAS